VGSAARAEARDLEGRERGHGDLGEEQLAREGVWESAVSSSSRSPAERFSCILEARRQIARLPLSK